MTQLTKPFFWGLRSLAGSLPQTATNGASSLGSLNWPPLPHFLPNNVTMSPRCACLSLTNCSICRMAAPGVGGLRQTPVQQTCPIQVRNPPGLRPSKLSFRPLAGVTRYYDWTVSRSTLAPDGVPVDVMLVNGEFPGPLIEANWGDWQA
jgi:hypothetical protein